MKRSMAIGASLAVVMSISTSNICFAHGEKGHQHKRNQKHQHEKKDQKNKKDGGKHQPGHKHKHGGGDHNKHERQQKNGK